MWLQKAVGFSMLNRLLGYSPGVSLQESADETGLEFSDPHGLCAER